MQIENPQPKPKPQNRSADVSGICVITATMGGEEGAVKARAHRGTNTEARPVSVSSWGRDASRTSQKDLFGGLCGLLPGFVKDKENLRHRRPVAFRRKHCTKSRFSAIRESMVVGHPGN